MRRLLAGILFGLLVGLGSAALLLWLRQSEPPAPDPAAVATKIREVARLEALDVTLYKKISFAPDPQPGKTLWGDVVNWARFSVRPPQGKAIVFAEAHLGLDLEKLGPDSIRVVGRTVYVVLPKLQVRVELKPGETEVIGSNLDTAESAQLFELAKAAFAREVEADAQLQARAHGAAERAIRGLLFQLGFDAVQFVESLPGPGGAS